MAYCIQTRWAMEENYANSSLDSIAATQVSGSISQNRVDNRREIY